MSIRGRRRSPARRRSATGARAASRRSRRPTSARRRRSPAGRRPTRTSRRPRCRCRASRRARRPARRGRGERRSCGARPVSRSAPAHTRAVAVGVALAPGHDRVALGARPPTRGRSRRCRGLRGIDVQRRARSVQRRVLQARGARRRRATPPDRVGARPLTPRSMSSVRRARAAERAVGAERGVRAAGVTRCRRTRARRRSRRPRPVAVATRDADLGDGAPGAKSTRSAGRQPPPTRRETNACGDAVVARGRRRAPVPSRARSTLPTAPMSAFGPSTRRGAGTSPPARRRDRASSASRASRLATSRRRKTVRSRRGSRHGTLTAVQPAERAPEVTARPEDAFVARLLARTPPALARPARGAVPPELGAHRARDALRARVAGRTGAAAGGQPEPRAPQQHVADGARLLAPDRVGDLGQQVGRPATIGSASSPRGAPSRSTSCAVCP